MNGCVISWGKLIRRSKSLAYHLGYEEVNVVPATFHQKAKLLSYAFSFFKSVLLLRGTKYKVVIVVMPPVFVLYALYISKMLFNREAKIIADLHNGVLRKEWRGWPLFSFLLKKCEVVISHNNVVKERIDKTFNLQSFSLSDPLITIKKVKVKDSSFIQGGKVNVLVPLSYAKDEPIHEILQAAKELSNTHNLILTGNYSKLFKQNEIEELAVTFTGYIDDTEYESLLTNSEMVLCLTLDEEIQMCALIEAISYKKKIICSNSMVNLEMFKNYGCMFVNNNSKDLVAGFEKLNNENGDESSLRESFIIGYMDKWAENAGRILEK